MNELATLEEKRIENMIYKIRGKQVMLDSDLAVLYQVETKRINEAVKNNLEKFPERFSWILTESEYSNLRSKISTSSLNEHGGRRYIPRVFTEQGVYMLATILKSKVATKITLNIMDTFVLMRNYISNGLLENEYYKEMLISHDNRIKILEEQFKTKNNHVFFEGQIYDAYSLIKDIFYTSKKEIIIIDNYLDKSLLDIVSKINNKVFIITNQYNNEDYNKYKSQYNNITLKINKTFHNRFIIIDRKSLYHCGASFKDLGKKCFAITLVEDNEILCSILKKI